MTNILLYDKINQLKNYLEDHSLDEVSKDSLQKAIYKVNEIFALLERRKEKR